jgi:hypothetical protein
MSPRLRRRRDEYRQVKFFLVGAFCWGGGGVKGGLKYGYGPSQGLKEGLLYPYGLTFGLMSDALECQPPVLNYMLPLVCFNNCNNISFPWSILRFSPY